MSIASKLQELDAAKDEIFDAIEAKGVTVPAGSGLADAPELIGSIPGGGGGTPVTPEGYVSGFLKKLNNNSTGITTSASKLQTSDTCIIEALYYIKGGYGGWGSDFELFSMNQKSGNVVAVSLRNNTSSNQCSPDIHYMYNGGSNPTIELADVVHIVLNENDGLWNGANTFAKNGRRSGVFTSNGIKRIFYGGDWNGQYAGSIFYYLTMMDNGAYTHYLVPAKKSDNSVVVLDLITLDEYTVNTSNFQFIQ